MKQILSFFLLALGFLPAVSQTVGIGTTTPNSSAILDVQSSTKGILVPRIALTAANSATPVTAPADALLVYNTATAGTGSNAIVPGFYYWNTSAGRWSAMKETVTTNSVGFGSWGDCSMNNISEYNPVVDANGAAGDQFGKSVSISGNYAIVGAEQDDVGANADQGSASIYQYIGTNWVFMQKITDATGAAGDLYGASVSISGNYAIVGAWADNVGGNAIQGSASIYQYVGGNWVLMQKIIDATGAAGDAFGYSVSISGNYAIVGAFYDDVGVNADQGSASIYQYIGGNWVLMNKVTDATGAVSDWFGRSVSISGNYAIAGANHDDVGANVNQGSASIYQYNGTNWVLMNKITDATGAADDNFGNSVSISGNYSIVGAHRAGSASIYQYNGSNWVLMQKISGSSSDYFGFSVSISGSYAIIGAYLGDVGGNADQGSASIYQRVGLGWQKLQYITDPGGTENNYFGYSTAIDGSTKRFLIGAWVYGSNSGKAVFGKVN
ncbi:MAG: FG-GAP repeat protein [Chitinophagaceae bacterium]